VLSHHTMSTKKQQMASLVALLAFLAAPCAALVLQTSELRSFGSAVLRPQATAQLMAHIEDTWKVEADTYTKEAQDAFGKSCKTVATAVVVSSQGDHDRVQEYMGQVCHEGVLNAWHSEWCEKFKAALGKHMKFNNYANRAQFDSTKFCSEFWTSFSSVERKVFVTERDAHRVQEAKALAVKQEQEAQALEEAKEKEAKALEAQHAAAKKALRAANERAKAVKKQRAAEQKAEQEKEAKALEARHAEERKVLREASERAKAIKKQQAAQQKAER